MYEKELEKLSKESLVELSNSFLSEAYYRGELSNNYIITMLNEILEKETEQEGRTAK